MFITMFLLLPIPLIWKKTCSPLIIFEVLLMFWFWGTVNFSFEVTEFHGLGGTSQLACHLVFIASAEASLVGHTGLLTGRPLWSLCRQWRTLSVVPMTTSPWRPAPLRVVTVLPPLSRLMSRLMFPGSCSSLLVFFFPAQIPFLGTLNLPRFATAGSLLLTRPHKTLWAHPHLDLLDSPPWMTHGYFQLRISKLNSFPL